MIATTELRINNLVLAGEFEVPLAVRRIYPNAVKLKEQSDLFDFDDKDLIAITLTDEWLLKFGFVKATDNYGGWLSQSVSSGSTESSKSHRLRITNNFNYTPNDFMVVEVGTVHRLQNLWFALFGKELETIDP